MAYRSALIDSFGNVFPCCYTYLDNFPYEPYEEQRKDFLLGNIHETSFKEIWYGDNYNRFRALTDPVDINQLGFFCGMCQHYFGFKKYKKIFNVLHKIIR